MTLNTPRPLTLTRVAPTTVPAEIPNKTIFSTWQHLKETIVQEKKFTPEQVENMRAGFVAGLYSCSAAVLNDQARSQSISETAFFIEKEE